jgi:hypothetical protein
MLVNMQKKTDVRQFAAGPALPAPAYAVFINRQKAGNRSF